MQWPHFLLTSSNVDGKSSLGLGLNVTINIGFDNEFVINVFWVQVLQVLENVPFWGSIFIVEQ